MRLDWKTLPLEECVERLIDYRGKSPRKTTAGIPLVTAKIVKGGRLAPVEEYIAASDYDEWMRRGLPQPGDVVITTEAPLGEVAQLDERRVALAQRIIALRGKSGVLDNTFLKFLLQSEFVQSQLMARASGSTVLGIRQSELRKVSLRLPPYDQQRAIARILGSLDDKIELNRRMNRTLESMARALFKSWFVDFDPVHANAAGTPTLPPDLAALFPSEFESSEIGDVPRGWDVGPILKHAELLSGGTPKTHELAYWDGDILWASAKDVSQCGEAFLIKTERKITEKGLNESSTRLLPPLTTVVVARGATTGRLAMWGQSMAMNQTCYALRTKHDTPFSLYCHARQFIEVMVNAAHGSVFDTITTSTFRTTMVLLHPLELRQRFDQTVAPLFKKILANQIQSQTLAALRDSLLPKLLSGELSVGDASEVAA